MCVSREISLTTKMIVEVQMRSAHLPWLKKEQITKEIDLENLFTTYWTSKAQEITVPGQSWY